MMENAIAKVMKVGKNICIYNAESKTSAFTTKDGLIIIKNGVQMPIRGEHLERDYVNGDGTRISSDKFTYGRVYSVRPKSYATAM